MVEYSYLLPKCSVKISREKNKAILESRVSPAFAITYFCNHFIIKFDSISAKTWNQRSLTPWWPLTPSLLRSHVWLSPKIIVTKSHENTFKYVDTVTLYWKTWTKGHWPLDDRWPHVCWGHMCDSTQELLCLSPMGIHQCMWIQWSILQKKKKKTHILRTYYIHTHTTYRMSNPGGGGHSLKICDGYVRPHWPPFSNRLRTIWPYFFSSNWSLH